MGTIIAKKMQGEMIEEEAAKQARKVGRMSMVIRAMRPRGRDETSPSSASDGPPVSSLWSRVFSNRVGITASPALGVLSEQDEMKLTREEELRQLASSSEETDYDDPDGKLKYDAGTDVQEDEFEDPCSICNMYKRDTVLTCRVCGRPFHHWCILGRGQGMDENSTKAMENAETDIGWSCPDCEALSELLSMDDINDLMIKFDLYDNDGDSVINLSNYMQYESTKYEQDYNDCMPGTKVKECEEAFRLYDRDNDGTVSWWDYSMLEAVKLLQGEPKARLLEHLKPREIAKLKKFFKMSDRNNIGLVTVGESEQAYRGWLRALGLSETEEMMRSFERSSSTDECSKMITWERFIRSKALPLITARPNTLTIKPYITSQGETAL